MTMKQGEVAVITASPENAYGADGFPSWGILPNSTLRFEIEVRLQKSSGDRWQDHSRFVHLLWPLHD